MNTLQVINGLSKDAGGTAFCVPPLCNALARLGACRFLINTRTSGDGENNFPDSKLVHTINVSAFKISFIRWAPKLAQVIKDICRKESVQLIHNHGVWQPGAHTAARMARRLNIPLVITTHGMLTQWHFRHKAWKKLPAWWLYQKKDLENARVVHITSPDEGDDLRKIGFKGPMALIPNGTEIPEWRAPFNKPKRIRTALFFSRIHLKKGLLNLVEAWAQIRPKGWRMLMVGPDMEGYGKIVQNAIREKKLENEMIIQAPVYGHAKWDVYRSADLFILPTYTENFGIVIPEAMACGLPVITTHGTPWSELNEKKCGWWIPIGVKPLAEALRNAIKASDAERKAMGKRGRKLVEEKYTWDLAAKKMKVLYEWIVGGGHPPPFMRFD